MITDHHAIHALLGRLVSERVMLSVFLPSAEDRFDSLLLGFERDDAALFADELRPDSGHRLVAPGVPMRVVTRLDGVEVRFRTRVRAIDQDGPVAAYRLDVPAEVDYREQRLSYRVRIAAPLAVSATLTAPNGETAAARVVDLSLAGVGLVLAHPHPLKAPDLWHCAIALPDGELTSLIEVRHAHTEARGAREGRAGARFVELGVDQQRRIGRFTADMQRRLLRARRSLTHKLDS